MSVRTALLTLMLALSFWLGIIYVVLHFVIKYW